MASTSLYRTIFRISGEGIEDWLNNLITNKIGQDITFAALLTPQGKIIADFFLHKSAADRFYDGDKDDIYLETASKFAPDLLKRLKMYRLRAPIEITETLLYVTAIWDGHPRLYDDCRDQIDPRHPSLGLRRIVTRPSQEQDDYDAHRLSLGVPESIWDFESAKVFPADANMDLLNGVNFSKGCFVGQEVVSRMKRMTTVKKRMRGLILDGDAKAGDRIMSGERVIGDLLHVNGNMGMAMIRLDRKREAVSALTVNGSPVDIMNSITGEDV